MPRIALTGGSYQARGLIASAQTCLNLIPEPMPAVQGEPTQYTYYPRPGLQPFSKIPNGAAIRGIYAATNGSLWIVAGNTVYSFASVLNGIPSGIEAWGTISSSAGPVRMQDNGLVLMIVDGSANGWYVTLVRNSNSPPALPGLTQISDPAFYGSVTLATLDTFLILSAPLQGAFLTNNMSGSWYVSPSNYAGNSTPFDALYVARKSTYPDNVVAISYASENLWLLGTYSCEIWYTGGQPDFPFARVQGVALDNGCSAPYSVATDSSAVFWLSAGPHGQGLVMMGQGASAQRISTWPIETAIASYATISDAIGAIYQLGGHTCYVLTFPTGNATWVYDVTTQLWHSCSTVGANGQQNAWSATFFAAAYGMIWGNGPTQGSLYTLSLSYPQDDQLPITLQRCFPHLTGNGPRMRHDKFTVDFQAEPVQVTGPITLDWSDDRGATFNTPITLAVGNSTLTWPTAWRLGMARDRVYRVTCTVPFGATVALNGAFIDATAVRT